MTSSRLKTQAALAAIMATTNPFDVVENTRFVNSPLDNYHGKPPRHRTKQERKLRARSKSAKKARRAHRGNK